MKRTLLAWVLPFGLALAPATQAIDLLGAYQLATANDPQIHIAKATRDAALENKPLARSRLLPGVNLSGNANLISSSSKSSFFGNRDETFGKYNLSLNLKQTLYNKEFWAQLAAADYQVASAEADYVTARQDLIIRVAQAYFNVLNARDTLVFSRAEKQANKRQLEQAQQRFDVGLIAITDVHEAQAGFDASVAAVIAAENALDNAHEALREIVGDLSDDELASLKKRIALVKPEPENIDAWKDTALEQNPSVISTRNKMFAARENVEVKRAGYYPTVDLVGQLGLDRSDSDAGSDTDSASLGVQLAVPLYTGGGVAAATRQAAAQYQAAKDGLEKAMRGTTRGVRDAYRGVLSSISSVLALKAGTVSAQSALDATEAGFNVGTRTSVDVLISQRRLFQANRDYSKARYDYIVNTLRLKQAAGTLSEQDLEAVNRLLGEGK